MVIDNNVEIINNGDKKFILKHNRTNKYIKVGQKEVKYLLQFSQEDKFHLDLDFSDFKALEDDEKEQLYQYYVKNEFLVEKSISIKNKIWDFKMESLQKIYLLSFDLDKFLEKIKIVGKICFNPIFLGIYLVVFFIGTNEMIKNQDYIQKWINFEVKARSQLILLILTYITTFLHELSHGLACKHCGGKVKKMGILLFYLSPVAYCNVNDMHLLKSKKKKILISSSGILMNFLLANISMILFSIGLKNDILVGYYLMNLGIGFYNLIPLVKMDGYWILSSILGETNLMEKSAISILTFIMKPKKFIDFNLKNRKKLIYIFFGISSLCFKVFFWTFSIWKVSEFFANFLGCNSIYFIVFLGGLVIKSILQATIHYVRKIKLNVNSNIFSAV